MYIMSLDGEPIFVLSNTDGNNKFVPDYIFRTAIVRLAQNSHNRVTSIKYQNIEYIIISNPNRIVVIGFDIDSVHVGYILLEIKKILNLISFENYRFSKIGTSTQIRSSCLEFISYIMNKIEKEILDKYNWDFDDSSIGSELQI